MVGRETQLSPSHSTEHQIDTTKQRTSSLRGAGKVRQLVSVSENMLEEPKSFAAVCRWKCQGNGPVRQSRRPR